MQEYFSKIQNLAHDAGRKAIEMDEKDEMCSELIDEAFRNELMCLNYEILHKCVESIAKVNQAFAVTVAAHHMSCLAQELADPKKDCEIRLGDKLSCFALTEPQSGSDLKNLKTEVKDGELSGVKTLITNAEKAEIFTVLAKNGNGYSLCVIECDINERQDMGIEVKKLNSAVFRGSGLSMIKFNSTPVSFEFPEGLKIAMKVLNLSRPVFSSIALGISKGCLNRAKGYMFSREVFGKKISEFQGLQWMFAEVYAETEALKCLIEKFIETKDVKLSPICKYLAAKTVKKAADFAVEVMGGHGLIKGCYVERAYRDAKAFDIGEGTTEIMKIIIARNELR